MLIIFFCVKFRVEENEEVDGFLDDRDEDELSNASQSSGSSVECLNGPARKPNTRANPIEDIVIPEDAPTEKKWWEDFIDDEMFQVILNLNFKSFGKPVVPIFW